MKTGVKIYLVAMGFIIIGVILPYLSFLPFETKTLNNVGFGLVILAVIILGKEWWTKGMPSEKNSVDK
ncbi:MAG: hypothetical protein LBD38_00025 [Streptococcaceae bacterium]|jgi:hypothetical protein|nr:hypothetical protein [Streptococcaceae bacterium]